MRIGYAETALADLDAIHDYQAVPWPLARAAFEARLTAIETRLLQFPHGAPEVAERPGVRVAGFIDLPYRLFYRVNEEAIEVLAIRHASRRPLYE
ncbi:MAG: type II toxin-antitoxin system RelE/ParE family toxin [Roseiarcus sp.]